jgi:glycosyltransferase involved in cell wall biosynthesis
VKVAYFTESLYPLVDGVSRTLARLFATLEREEVDFRVFSPFHPDPSVEWRDRVQEVRHLPLVVNPGYRISLPGGREVREALGSFRPDLVHVVSPTPMAVWAQRWARRAGVPSVASFHTHFVSYFPYYRIRRLEPLGWSLLRRFYRRSQRVYVPSWSIIRELRDEGIENLELWSRGIDLSAFSPHYRDPTIRAANGADEDTPLLLLVSRLVKEKDLADLVKVDAELRRRGVRFRLALVGDGPMRGELEAKLPEAHFAGHQSGKALARWYASGDVFVFPSTTETLGNVVLEALASGLPAVVVDRGGPQDLVEPGVTGFVARANDIADIADRVESLLRDRTLRARMATAGIASASSRDWDTINRGLVESYRSVIAGAPAREPGNLPGM